MSRTTSYVRYWYETCINGLSVTEAQFKVERSVAAIAYAQFLQSNARADNWYNLHIILVGCYWVSIELALKVGLLDVVTLTLGLVQACFKVVQRPAHG